MNRPAPRRDIRPLGLYLGYHGIRYLSITEWQLFDCNGMVFDCETKKEGKMYEKCIKCDKLGKTCVPYFAAMQISEVLAWCRARKQFLRWSNAELADRSRVPKGTIDAKLSGKNGDITYSTLQPILCALVGYDGKEIPCVPSKNEATEKDKETVDYLKRQIVIKRRAIIILGVSLAVFMLATISFLLYDALNESVGIFWITK